MPASQIQTPVRATDHGATLNRKQKPWNRLPLLKEQAAKRLLDKGIQKTAICEQLGISKTALHRIVSERSGNGTALVPKVTKVCTHRPNCPCVYHQAEAEREAKLAERRNELRGLR